MEAVRAQSVAIWEACVWMAAWDGDARTTLSFCRDGQGWVCAGVCVSLGAPHMEKPVWGGASGLLPRACVEDRTVQWILCSPMRTRGTDRGGA